MKAWDDGDNDPVFQKHYARVMLSWARASRQSRRPRSAWWTHTVLAWAGQARQRARDLTPRDLFGPIP